MWLSPFLINFFLPKKQHTGKLIQEFLREKETRVKMKSRSPQKTWNWLNSYIRGCIVVLKMIISIYGWSAVLARAVLAVTAVSTNSKWKGAIETVSKQVIYIPKYGGIKACTSLHWNSRFPFMEEHTSKRKKAN